jgi:hypothetical protein
LNDCAKAAKATRGLSHLASSANALKSILEIRVTSVAGVTFSEPAEADDHRIVIKQKGEAFSDARLRWRRRNLTVSIRDLQLIDKTGSSLNLMITGTTVRH